MYLTFTATAMKIIKFLLLFSITVECSNAFSISTGSCKNVQAKTRFQIDRMLGAWYVIQKNNLDEQSKCLHYDIFKSSDGEYKLRQWFPHSYTIISTLFHEHQSTGTLTLPKENSPTGNMILDIPSENGLSIFVILMTDYNQHAVVYRCQNLVNNTHKWSVEVLSRNRNLNRLLLSDIHRQLPSYNLDPFNLYNVLQNNCPVAIQQRSNEGDIVVGVMNGFS